MSSLTCLTDDALHGLRDRCTARLLSLDAQPERTFEDCTLYRSIVAMRERVSAELDRRHRR